MLWALLQRTAVCGRRLSLAMQHCASQHFRHLPTPGKPIMAILRTRTILVANKQNWGRDRSEENRAMHASEVRLPRQAIRLFSAVSYRVATA